ncbi:MAG: tetratricopeptide repeat protein [Myxococcaceae bacterium]|nr:tetratricopeptide repeat protein [Myxococcaceae bacterium]
MTRVALVAALVLCACKRNDAPTHLEAARSALYAQKPEVALSEFKLALDTLERQQGPEVTLYRARALRGAADIYAFQLHEPKRAVEVYRELITTCPEAPETMEGRLHLAELLRHEFRDIRAAIAELTAALARNPPQSAELAYEVATLYFELRDYQQVTIEADSVVRKYEASAWVDDALYLKGQALSMMEGRKPEAQRSYMELVDRFPDSPLKPHALVELGRLKVDQGESERAIEYWVESLKTHPDPKVVQTAIARVRAHLRATTPDTVGDPMKAFDWGVPGAAVGESGRPLVLPKTSAEAVGASKEEAEREQQQFQRAPTDKPPEGTSSQGEGSF